MTRAPRRAKATILVAFVAAVTWGSAASHAHAQPKTEKAAADQRARELFLKADAAYAEGRYEEALAKFQEAHDLSGRPQLLFNISNALERLGRYEEAVLALEKYLASGKAKDRDVVQKRLVNLKKRVEEQKKEQEKLAKEEEERREREEAERRKLEEERRLAQPNGEQGVTTPEEKPKTPVVPWIVIGTGTALLVTGAVFGILTLGARSEVNDSCVDAPAGRLCDAEGRSAIDREQTFGIVADIGILSGLVLGAVGTYLLFKDKPVDPHVRVGVRPAPGGGGIQLGGRF